MNNREYTDDQWRAAIDWLADGLSKHIARVSAGEPREEVRKKLSGVLSVRNLIGNAWAVVQLTDAYILACTHAEWQYLKDSVKHAGYTFTDAMIFACAEKLKS